METFGTGSTCPSLERCLACVQTYPISFVAKEIGDVCTQAKRCPSYRGSNKGSKGVIAVKLTIIPRARMGSESIADEAEGRMGY